MAMTDGTNRRRSYLNINTWIPKIPVTCLHGILRYHYYEPSTIDAPMNSHLAMSPVMTSDILSARDRCMHNYVESH